MKILNNQGTTLFRIGDKHRGSTIMEEVPCISKTSCQETYENFEMCGGFRYVLDSPIYGEKASGSCLFQVRRGGGDRPTLEERENRWGP